MSFLTASDNAEPLRIHYRLIVVAVLLMLMVMYAPAIFTLYVYSDEMSLLDEGYLDNNVITGMIKVAKRLGRPIPGLFYHSYDDLLLGTGAAGVMMLRVFAAITTLAGAAVFLGCLRLLAVPPIHAAVITLFLWSQPGLMLYAYYAFLAPYWIGLICAFASFAISWKRRDLPLRGPEALGHFTLFGIGLCTFQMTPFAVVGLIGYAMLMDDRARYFRRLLLQFMILVGTVGIYTVSFKLVSGLFKGVGNYPLARQMMEEGGAGLFTEPGFLLAFEFWNYPVPVPALPMPVKVALTGLVAALWLLLLVAAFLKDRRSDSRLVTARWAVALAATASAWLPIVAAGGDPRQHLQVGVLIAVVLVGYAALRKLTSGEIGRGLGYALSLVTVVVAIGAVAGTWRAIVRPYAAFLAETSAVIAQAQTTSPDWTRLVVILRPSDARGCTTEPCTAFYGRRYPEPWHENRPGFYRIAALMAGVSPDFEIIVGTAVEPAPGDLVLDLNAIWMPAP